MALQTGNPAFCDGATALVDKGRAIDIGYLYSGKLWTVVHMISLSLNWRDVGLTDGPLGG